MTSKFQRLRGTDSRRTAEHGARSGLLLAALCLVLVPLASGCSFTVSSATGAREKSPGPNVVSERANARDIWLALAHAAEAKTIDSTSRLAQFVVVLARNGDLSAADVNAFDTAFPSIAKNDRPLTDDDVKRLRILK